MPQGEEPRPAGEWVLLSYRLPREPSTPRISLWRRLKRYGVLQVGDGLVALPADARTREQLEWAAQETIEVGGTAAVWLARPAAVAHERAMAHRMAGERALEYADLAVNAEQALRLPPPQQARTLRALRRRWREITRRDFFPPPQREAAAAALRALSTADAAEPVEAATPREPAAASPGPRTGT